MCYVGRSRSMTQPLSHPEIVAKGEQILALVDRPQRLPKWMAPSHWAGRLMERSMSNEALKVQTLRFVDVLPALHTSSGVVGHLREYFRDEKLGPLRLGLPLADLAPWIAGPAIRRGAGEMARQFITGRDGADASRVLRKLRARHVGFTVDILGEAVVSEREADEYAKRYLELIESLSAETAGWAPDPLLDGAPLVNVSVKISALYSQIHPADPEGALAHLKARLRPLFIRAKELGAFINLDMESYAVKELTLRLYQELLDEPAFAGWDGAGLVIQAYLRDAGDDLERMIAWARERSRRITVRLVKGAYWDYETVIARQRDWPIPVFLQKHQSDASFERLSRRMLEESALVYSAFGTHNVRSMANAIACAERLGIGPDAYELQMLYGMAEPIKAALVQMGHRVREYCPVGEMLPGMAYLVRRLLENTSNEGFLKAKFSSHASSAELLRDPAQFTDLPPPTMPQTSFRNEPPTDFTLESNRQKMRDALAAERAALGAEHPLFIDGQPVRTAAWIDSVNPARPTEIVGRVGQATREQAQLAVDAALRAIPGWRATAPEARAAVLERIAELLREERFRLSALEVLEVGKAWIEADGDLAEAIDFCDYYAAEMRRLAAPERTAPVPGEDSFQEYIPRGLGVVIAPWNFPLAILCGMTTAALVTGNAVIMKPAEQSGVIAARFMEIAARAGVPAGVLQLVSGLGEEVGEFLVEHPRVDFIAFTGSKEVGLKIWEAGGRTRPGQGQLKRVVCEMGGKNALIIDADADLDEAVVGAVYSAFGYQGQKCSALSRLIVLAEVYDAFVARLVEAVSDLKVGSPEEPGTVIGPVIDEDAQKRIQKYVAIGKGEAKLAFEGVALAEGYFIPPTIFIDAAPDSKIAREELFGPVLTVLKARDLDDALKIANDTEFALTGGFYSRSPANIEQVKREFAVGNLYINRTITGAIVARHPFGGFKMSGGGTKAGGRDYLLNFVFPRIVTENVLRRGFAPVDA